MKTLDPIQVVEACYAGPGDDVAWTKGILEAMEPATCGLGLYSLAVDLRAPDKVSWTPLADHGPVYDWRGSVAATHAIPMMEVHRAIYRPSPPVTTLSRRLAPFGPAFLQQVREMMRRSAGAADVLGVGGALHDGRVVAVGIPIDEKGVPPRTVHQLTRIAAHLTSGWRLRKRLEASPGDEPPDAVLDPSGKVLDAAPRAQPGPVRGALANAVRRVERARGRLRRADPEEALALWRGLVNGAWTLVDRVDTDGRRVVVVRRNDPGAHDPTALSAGERDVVAHVVMGHSNKYIAYLLGIAPSTVAGRLESVQAKLRLGSRRELIAFLGKPEKPDPPAPRSAA
jgi:DNA-binding CsgD family transcriptional regulator